MEGAARADDHDLLVALRHEMRRRILRAMWAEPDPISPRELALALDHPLSNVSYHVRVLADCSAVHLVEARPVRGSVQHFYEAAVDAPWALAVLGLSEDAGRAAGENNERPGA